MKSKSAADIKLPQLLNYLSEVSRDCGYQFEIIDRNLVKISSGKAAFFAGANGDMGINPINPHFACELASDKARSLQLLSRAGFKTVNGGHFFVSGRYKEAGKSPADAPAYAESLGFPVFVKPNQSPAARFASVDYFSGAAYSEGRLGELLKHIAEIDSIALVQEFVALPEYRIVAIEGEFQYSYKRVRPQIVGDGRKSVKELIEAFNAHLGGERISPDSYFIQAQLKERGVDTVLKQGETLNLSSIANLWAGGEVCEYSETASDSLKKWLREISTLFGLRVMGIDVFARGPIDRPENLSLIEVNHNPGHKIAPPQKVLEMLKRVCQTYFREAS